MRQLISPIYSIPCKVAIKGGPEFVLGSDPLDERIIAETYGQYSRLFFPPDVKDVPTGSWILDVGAHHGVYTVAALHRYPNCRVIAVEPDPNGCRILNRNITANGFENRSEVVQAAIANEEGMALLEQSSDGSWGNRLVHDASSHSTLSVITRTLKSILKGREPYLVKSNAEGGEFTLIPQLIELGLRPRFLILLAHPVEGDVEALMESVRRYGYSAEPVESDPEAPRYVCRLTNPSNTTGA